MAIKRTSRAFKDKSLSFTPHPDTNEFEVIVFFAIVGQDTPIQEFTFMLEATR